MDNYNYWIKKINKTFKRHKYSKLMLYYVSNKFLLRQAIREHVFILETMGDKFNQSWVIDQLKILAELELCLNGYNE